MNGKTQHAPLLVPPSVSTQRAFRPVDVKQWFLRSTGYKRFSSYFWCNRIPVYGISHSVKVRIKSFGIMLSEKIVDTKKWCFLVKSKEKIPDVTFQGFSWPTEEIPQIVQYVIRNTKRYLCYLLLQGIPDSTSIVSLWDYCSWVLDTRSMYIGFSHHRTCILAYRGLETSVLRARAKYRHSNNLKGV